MPLRKHVPVPEPVPIRAAARVPVLLNARAGALHATPGLEQIGDKAREAGLDVEVVASGTPDELRSTIRGLIQQGYGTVVVAGGDGTVNLAVQELAGSETVLGIIPQGTANNFATALRLPQDLPSALRVIAGGYVREVDLGRIGSHYFTEAAGVGLFADALALYGSRTGKNPFRMLYALTRLFFSLKAHRIRLTADDQVIHERAVMCEVANTYRMGLAEPVAPGARVTDGRLDLVVIGDLTRRELVSYYRAMKAQVHLGLPKVTSLKAKTVTIEARRRMKVHCDDRIIGSTPVTIVTVPRALRVLVEKP